ncbi:MAG: hypothetical protein PHY83_03060 [Bacilli bacterium]|nr:hypothetical protein [Bacilli bacterium]MDD3067546.1 hypothetical protein [Acholeplasmataceae bacterium]MDD4194359.1 hypothetical protein [Acholeplasmataceae bacterium]
MRKVVVLLLLVVVSFGLFACKDSGSEENSNILKFDHLNGHGDVVERDAYLLFEYEMRDYVKYQIAYVACTCRAPEVNYWKVAYVEISKKDNSIKTISFRQDGTGHYTAGFWGDSNPVPSGNMPTLEDFEEKFIPWLIGKKLTDLEGIEVFTNDVYTGGEIKNETTIAETDLIDFFAGASVTTNNMIRVMKVLLEYHEQHYDNE